VYSLQEALWWLIPIMLLVWYWQAAVKAKEAAIMAAKKRCQEEGVQMLDDSMAIDSLRLRRMQKGSMGLWRRYGFEFSATGNQRYQAWVVVHGGRVVLIELPPHRMH